jgi:hypothetical protein
MAQLAGDTDLESFVRGLSSSPTPWRDGQAEKNGVFSSVRLPPLPPWKIGGPEVGGIGITDAKTSTYVEYVRECHFHPLGWTEGP